MERAEPSKGDFSSPLTVRALTVLLGRGTAPPRCQGLNSSKMSRAYVFILSKSPSPGCAPQRLQHCHQSVAVCTALIYCANEFFRNLECGKLVCVFPNRIPFTKVKGAVIYAQVQEHLCVSFDFLHGPTAPDPLLVKEGTKCGPGKVRNNARAAADGMELSRPQRFQK